MNGIRKAAKDGDDESTTDAVEPTSTDVDDLDGPFDIDDFDDPSAAELGRLDLGSVLIPMPEAGQVQVELTEMGVPSAVWVVTPNGRFTIAAYAAPKTAGLWREVASELADSLRKDVAQGQHRGRPVGPRGRRLGEQQDQLPGVVRFIGVDGYRWMIRCVVNGPAGQDRRRWPPKHEMHWRTPSFAAARRRCRSAPRYRCNCPSRWRRSCVRRPNRPPSSRLNKRSRPSHRRPSLPLAAASLGRPCSSCGPSQAVKSRWASIVGPAPFDSNETVSNDMSI